MLNIDPFNLLCTAINLLVIAFVIKKFLFGRVKAIVAKRAEEVEEQYSAAERVKEETAKEKEQYEQSLFEAEEKKNQMLGEARDRAGKEYDRILADAKMDADKILEIAKKQAEMDAEKSRRHTEEQIAELIVAATAKVVASGQGQAADKELYNQFLAKTGEEQ